MNYQEALEKLERLRDDYIQFIMPGIPQDPLDSLDEVIILYGELEEVINRFAGIDEILVPPHNTRYSNYIAATLLGGSPLYRQDGYRQLLKIIGKIRQHAKDPTVPQAEYSVTNLAHILRRFRECCQYFTSPLESELEVQNILWIMLRSHFDRLERHNTLPRFGAKSYVPDFGIPNLRILIEAKFIGPNTNVGDIQEGILADIPGYLNDVTSYDSVIVFVYDAVHKLRDAGKFIEDLKTVEGIIDVIVIPGIG